MGKVSQLLPEDLAKLHGLRLGSILLEITLHSLRRNLRFEEETLAGEQIPILAHESHPEATEDSCR